MSNDNNTYTYKAFGLNIASEFEIPELYPSGFSHSDVLIRYGSVPDNLEEVEKKGVRFQLNKEEFLLHVDGIASYYVQEGKRVFVHTNNNVTPLEIRLFLLSSVFSALLYLRGFVSLHASAIRNGDKCFLVCGNSGAGKSTLSREFIKQDYQILSDDISVLSKSDNKIMIQPSFPFIKLWKDSLEHLGLTETKGHKLRAELEKYGFFLESEFYPEPLEVEKVFVLLPHNKPGYTTETLKGVEKFNALKNHTFRYYFLPDKIRPVHFEFMNKLANQSEAIRIRRPQAPIHTEKLRTEIEKFL